MDGWGKIIDSNLSGTIVYQKTYINIALIRFNTILILLYLGLLYKYSWSKLSHQPIHIRTIIF